MSVRYFYRCLANDVDRHLADGWTESERNGLPIRIAIPSLKEPIAVLERPTLVHNTASDCQCEMCTPLAAEPSATVKRAVKWLDAVGDLLIEKNRKYGDSAANPMRVFSRATPTEQLLVRIDDKLSRIARGDGLLAKDEDVLVDLVGYLALLAVTKE